MRKISELSQQPSILAADMNDQLEATRRVQMNLAALKVCETNGQKGISNDPRKSNVPNDVSTAVVYKGKGSVAEKSDPSTLSGGESANPKVAEGMGIDTVKIAGSSALVTRTCVPNKLDTAKVVGVADVSKETLADPRKFSVKTRNKLKDSAQPAGGVTSVSELSQPTSKPASKSCLHTLLVEKDNSGASLDLSNPDPSGMQPLSIPEDFSTPKRLPPNSNTLNFQSTQSKPNSIIYFLFTVSTTKKEEWVVKICQDSIGEGT